MRHDDMTERMVCIEASLGLVWKADFGSEESGAFVESQEDAHQMAPSHPTCSQTHDRQADSDETTSVAFVIPVETSSTTQPLSQPSQTSGFANSPDHWQYGSCSQASNNFCGPRRSCCLTRCNALATE